MGICCHICWHLFLISFVLPWMNNILLCVHVNGVWGCVPMGTHVCMCLRRSEVNLCYHFLVAVHLGIWDSISHRLTWSSMIQLSGWPATLSIYLSLPPQCWNYKLVPSCVGSGTWTWVFKLVLQVFSWLRHLTGPMTTSEALVVAILDISWFCLQSPLLFLTATFSITTLPS